jgi:DNA-directed RNA polymerase specialized sigma24 family protein
MNTQGSVASTTPRQQSDERGSVTKLVSWLRSENTDHRNEAARLIWERYFHALLALARDNLRPRIRRRESEEDVLQDMYASFCRRQRRGEFDLANRDQLWGLLVRITLCKVRNTANKHRSKKRDINREEAWQPGDAPGALSLDLDGIRDRGPGPSEAAVLNEALEQRLSALDDSRLRSLALQKLEGWTNAEIAISIGRTERAVERKLKLIRECWRDKDPGLIKMANESQAGECGS